MVRRLLVFSSVVLALVLVFLVVPGRAANLDSPQAQTAPEISGKIFRAYLTGANEVPPVNTVSYGKAVLILDDDNTTLHYRVMVRNMKNITAAHIHIGEPGTNGAVIFPLYTSGSGVFDTLNPISGTLTLSSTQVADLNAGKYYVNVHTTEHPNGEIRGQIYGLVSAPLSAILLGSNQVPSVDSPARGVARFQVDMNQKKLNYEIEVSDILSITLVHLKIGAEGENGAAILSIYNRSTDPGDFGPGSPIMGSIDIDALQAIQILLGQTYVNISTEAHPQGEIRGQVRRGFYLFGSQPSGGQLIPPVDTTASGKGFFALDPNLNNLYYQIQVTGPITITSAGIFSTTNGVLGSPLFSIPTTGLGDGSWISGTLVLSETQAASLAAGDFALGILTEAHPTGELLGQITPVNPGIRLRSFLGDGAGQGSPSGVGDFRLNPDFSTLSYHLSVSNVVTATAAMINTGKPGGGGSPFLELYGGAGETRPFGSGSAISGEVPLDPASVLNLVSGNAFLSIEAADQETGPLTGEVVGYTYRFMPMIAAAAPQVAAVENP